MEVVGSIRRGGEPGEQRGERQADDLVDAPERCARAERAVRARAQFDGALFVAGDQSERCRKGHLKTRMHHRFRRKQQHDQRRDGQSAHRHRRPVRYYGANATKS